MQNKQSSEKGHASGRFADKNEVIKSDFKGWNNMLYENIPYKLKWYL